MNTTTITTEQGRKVFDATMRSAQSLMHRGVDPVAIAAALLACATEIASAQLGPAETARMLRIAALELDHDSSH